MNRIFSSFIISAVIALGVTLFSAHGRAAAPPRLPALGVDLEGTWDGMLQTTTGAMPITLSITGVDGKSAIAVDILEQNVRDIPVNGASRDGDKLKLDVAALDGAFEGTITPATGLMQGTWIQAGKRIPLSLKHRTAE